MSDLIDDADDLFDNAPCGYLTLSVDGRIHRVNQTLCAWLGFSRSELEGKRLHDLLNMPGRIFYETHIAPLLRMQGFFEEVALDLVTKSDNRIPVIANAVEHRNAAGKPVFTRIALLRAAGRRRYERELLNSRTSAQEGLKNERAAAELREQFIAVLGHDLRNPLASISAGARILMREQRNDLETRVLAMMQSTVIRMSALIDDTLDFARGRLGGGISVSRDHNVNLEPVLHQVIDELRASAPNRTIERRFSLTRPVDCDKSRIGQLASNLIGNALSHGSSDRPVVVSASTADKRFSLYVSNGGAPIPDKAMARLFEPFFRGEVRDSKQGLGLGLYIASEIAKSHGGSLTVRSTPEETRFSFEMPLIAD
ncbi:MAG TPA: ATP-binding protein [Afipia sp.]